MKAQTSGRRRFLPSLHLKIRYRASREWQVGDGQNASGSLTETEGVYDIHAERMVLFTAPLAVLLFLRLKGL